MNLVRAVDISVGQVVVLPGTELHDDLRGLWFQFVVKSIKVDGEQVCFTGEDGKAYWFLSDEFTRVES